jgi:hypothetical protein
VAVRTPTARGTALILLGVILGFLGIVEIVALDSRRAIVDVVLAVVAIAVGGVLIGRDRAS